MANRSLPPSPSADGAAFTWILEHVMQNQGSYEIPLRTMYEINLSQSQQLRKTSSKSSNRGVPLRNAFSRPAANDPGPGAANIHDTTAMFKANLMERIAKSPSQPTSLPPSFITSFVRRCFPAELAEADFVQALAALDYLWNLESKRKKTYESALKKLELSEVDDENDDLSKRPVLAEWLATIKSNNNLAQAHYTQIYVRLRQWTVAQEILTEPYNRGNCIAMLNTLFPPISREPQTRYLSAKMLQEYRVSMVQTIQDYERRGKVALDRILLKDKRPVDPNSWPMVHGHIEAYLSVANAMIDQCSDINRDHAVDESMLERTKKGRKVDSGISFLSSGRPSTSSSNGSSKMSGPTSPVDKPSYSGPTTLERIAKEIRKMKSRADLGGDVKEISKPQQSSKPLKKMKSAGFLRSRGKKSAPEPEPEDDPRAAFDPEIFKQKIREYEARTGNRRSG